MKDAPRILELYNKENYLSLSGQKNDYELYLVKEYLSKKSVIFFVCEENGKILGVIMIHLWKSYINLETMVVDKNARGKGIGKMLMNHVENFARKKKITWLEGITRIQNKEMQGLFAKLNYKRGGEFIAYFKELK